MPVKTTKLQEKRNKEILKRRRAGDKYADMARDYGISVSRVRQIYEKYARRYGWSKYD